MDNGDFTPMVFSSCGGAGPQAMIALKKLAEAIAVKRGEDYAKVAYMMRCKLAFCIARSALVCLRGSRSFSKRHRPRGVDQAAVLLEEVGFRGEERGD